MVILGLTGSIGMGKSTAANMLRRLGVPVCDSDRVVHDLLAKGGAAVAPVEGAFRGVVRDGAVDHKLLADRVFSDPAALRRLEAVLHPMVYDTQTRFLKLAAARGARLVALDVPLLFEVGSDRRCDAVIVVTAPLFLQAARVLGRRGMTLERFRGVLSRQTPDAEKRRRADFVVQTGLGRRYTLQRLAGIVKMMGALRGERWPPPGRRSLRGAHAGSRT